MGRRPRSVLSIVLVVIMLCTYMPVSTADSLNFDGTQSSWAEQELQEAYSYGLTYDAVERNYQNPITREEFCVIAVKMYEKLGGIVRVLGSNPFLDTTNPEILKAYAIGIVNGTSATTFSPNNNITRQEVCVMILRALKAINPSLETTYTGDFPFDDSNKIATWALDAVKFAYKNEIMKGTGPRTISPLSNLTREQAIILLKRSYTKYNTETKEEAGPVGFFDMGNKEFTGAPDYYRDIIKPYVPSNPWGTISKVDTSKFKFNSSLINNLGLIDNLKPVGEDMKFEPGFGYYDKYIDMSQLTPEEIEEIWAERQNYSGEYEPSGFPLKENESNIAGVTLLGRGINVVTDMYADSKTMAMRPYILDIKKLLRDGKVYKEDASTSISDYVEGNNITTYTQKMAQKVGVDGGFAFFKASAEVNFNSSSFSQSNQSYATLLYLAPQYVVLFNDINMKFIDYMDASFKAAIIDPNVPPEEIFNLYGTHVLRSLVMGGRLDYNVNISSSYKSQSSSLRTDIEASFDALIASGNASYSGTFEESNTQFASMSRRNMRAYPAYGGIDFNPEDFDEWFEGLERKPGVSNFGDLPLIPVWELVSNPYRRMQLKTGFDKYCRGEFGFNKPGPVKCITGIRLQSYTVGQTLGNIVPETYKDDVTNETWCWVSNISPHRGLPDETLQHLYVRYGTSDETSNPPVVAVFLVNETQGENAKDIFRKYWGNDPSAKLWGYGANFSPGLDKYVSAPPLGYNLRLYYVTSTNGIPITHIRMKHITMDNKVVYYPEDGSVNQMFYPVLDRGSLMNGEHKPQDCSEGAPSLVQVLPVHRFIFLEFAN